MIIRENRTYDQILGDVSAGNGDPSLAVFGANVTPNAHNLVIRFPLLDNFYTPSRQSADGHQWIVEAMAPTQTTSSRRTGCAAIRAATPAIPSPTRRRASCSRRRWTPAFR